MFAPLAMAGVSLSLSTSQATTQTGQATQFTITPTGVTGLSTTDSYSYHIYLTDSNGTVMSSLPFEQPTAGTQAIQTTATTVTDMVYGSQTTQPTKTLVSYPFTASSQQTVTGQVYGSLPTNLSSSLSFTLTPTDVGAYTVNAELYDDTTNTSVTSDVYTPLQVTAASSPTIGLTNMNSSTTISIQDLAQWSLAIPSGTDPSQLYYELQVTNADGTPTNAPVTFYLVGSSLAQIPQTTSPTEVVFSDEGLKSTDTSLSFGIQFGQTGSYQVTASIIDRTSGSFVGTATQSVTVANPNVTGTVYASDGTTPASDVTMLDIVPGGTASSTPSSTDITVPVDGTGTYQTYLNPGTSSAGTQYTIQGMTVSGQYTPLPTPVTFTVTPGQPTTVPGITEPTSTGGTVTVTGKLVSAEGLPLPYSQFELDATSGFPAASPTTDANGNFSVQVPIGDYQVTTIWTNGSQDLDNLSTPIDFTVTASTTSQNIQIPNAHVATLYAADGKTPMPNTSFNIVSTDPSNLANFYVTTGATGQFVLPITPDSYEMQNISDPYGQETLASPLSLTVSTSSATSSVVDPVANVIGTVYLDSAKQTPATNGQLEIDTTSSTSSTINSTDFSLGAGGKFVISLPQGTYSVSGISDANSNWQTINPPLTFTVGSGITNVTIAPPTGDAQFTVNNPDGTAVTNGQIAVLTATAYQNGDWTNVQWLPVSNGTASAQLDSGDYMVGGLSTPNNWYQMDVPFTVDQTAAQAVSVTVQPPQNDVLFNVKDANGTAVSQGDLVVMTQTDYDNQNWQNTYDFTISSGQAVGYLPRGGNYVVAGMSTDTGWTPLDIPFAVSSTLADGSSVTEAVAPAPPNVDFTVTTDGTTLVQNGDLTIVPAADLKDGSWANAVSAQVSGGQASISLQPGDYVATYLWTSSQSYPLSVPFTVTTSDTGQNPLTKAIAPKQPAVQGMVESAQGIALPYATLMVLPAGTTDFNQAIYLSADQNGHFTDLQMQPDGTLADTLTAGQAYTLYGVWDGQGNWTQMDTALDTTASDQPITVKLPAPDLSGTVTVNGQLLNDGFIAIGPAGSPSWDQVSWESVKNGTYTTSLPTGDYQVYGVQDNSTNNFIYTQSVSPTFSVDSTKSNTFNFSYTPNLFGTVTKNGSPLAYATLMLSPLQNPSSTADGWNQVEYVNTDSQGQFEANVQQGSTWYIVGVWDENGNFEQLQQAVQANPSSPVTVDVSPTVKGTVTWNQSPYFAWVVVQNTQNKQSYTASLNDNAGTWSYNLHLGTGSYQVLGIITQNSTGTENWIDLSAQSLTFDVTSSNTPVTEPINLSTSYNGTVSGNSGQSGYVVFSNASTGKLLSIAFDESGKFTTVFDGSAGWTVKGIETASGGYQAATGSFANNTWTVTVN